MRDALFLISTKFELKHATTSGNSADTDSRASAAGACGVRGWAAHTVVPHGDVRDDLLERGPALHTLLVLVARGLQLGAELLRPRDAHAVSAGRGRRGGRRTWILPRVKNFASWPFAELIERV
jgi:hypothetical protein